MLYSKCTFLEKAFIWTEWGTCDTTTCIQRRKRKCKDESKCKGSKDVEDGWEKFDRGCTDVTECFATVEDKMPVDGKQTTPRTRTPSGR